jgi:hypothetical protein
VELADAARGAFDWIGSVAVEVDGGLGWVADGVLADDLYSGTAGVLAGCAEAAAAGLGPAAATAGLGPAAGLGAARVSAGARARLLQLAVRGPDVASLPDDGLFTGWAGVAVALRAWSRAAADAAAASAAGQLAAQIAERILRAPCSPSATIPAAGRCRSRYRHDRAVRRRPTAGVTVRPAPCGCSCC